MENYLLDTNVVIYYLAGKLSPSDLDFIDEVVNRTATVSIITKLELLGWKNASKEDLKLPAAFLEDTFIVGLNDDVVDKTIAIRREHQIKLPDAIIAATSLVFNCTLITNNTTDFQKIKKLKQKSVTLI